MVDNNDGTDINDDDGDSSMAMAIMTMVDVNTMNQLVVNAMA